MQAASFLGIFEGKIEYLAVPCTSQQVHKFIQVASPYTSQLYFLFGYKLFLLLSAAPQATRLRPATSPR